MTKQVEKTEQVWLVLKGYQGNASPLLKRQDFAKLHLSKSQDLSYSILGHNAQHYKHSISAETTLTTCQHGVMI